MPDFKSPPDLSMEEILASIRRLVADEDRPGGTMSPRFGAAPSEPPKAAVDDDVLELTEAIAEDGGVRHLPPFGASAAAAPAGPVVSAAASSTAASAFARLAAALNMQSPLHGSAIIGDRMLDDIVKTELRPLLQAWLEANLPRIVERLVAAEIARIAGRAGREDAG
jgi:uncharacterized protein